MTKTLKVGVIGVGGIAHTHYPGWKQSPDAEMVALSDLAPATLQRVGEAQGVKKLYEKAEDLINDPDIDIVDVCTPNMYHAPLTIAALNAGKHVICEKPLAPTPADVKKMIAARDKSGKKLMTAQHFRYDGAATSLKAEIDAGALGEIYHARSWFLRRSGVPIGPGFIFKKNSGGGPCIDIGVHILDLTLWMMGNPRPVAVTGVTQDRLAHQPGAFSGWGGMIPKEFDVEEFASAFVRFDTGATLILEVSWLLHHNTGGGDDMQMWLYGDNGGAHWPSNELLSARMNTKQHVNIKLTNNQTPIEPHAMECIAFADAVANDKPSPVPAEQSLDVMAVLDGIYRSSVSRREVVLDY